MATSAWAQSTVGPLETVELYKKVGSADRVPVVTCIDVESQGKLLAIGGDDQKIRLWDVDQKTFLQHQFGQQHEDWIRGVAFSPDKSRLVTVCQDGHVRLWNVQNGTQTQRFENAGRGAQKVVFHPQGTSIAVCGFDMNVKVYDVATGSLKQTLAAHGTNQRTIAFSPDGSLLAVGGRTGVVRVWQLSSGKVLADLKGDGRRINAIAFSENGQRLAVAGDGPFITVWNPLDGSLLQTLPERPGKTFSLTFCGDDVLATGESDNAIRLWNLKTLQNTATLLGHTGTIATMIYEPTTQRLITGSFDTTFRFWNVMSTSATVPATATTVPVPTTF